MILRRPFTAWDVLRVEAGSSKLLLAACAVLASVALLPGLWPLRELSRGVLPMGAWLWLLPVALVSPPGVWILTWIERRGVVFFGKRRGWRVTPAVAWTVCAHAAFGWILAAAFVALGLHLSAFLATGRPTGNALLPRDIAISWAPLAGFFAGMLVFETLVYVGVRRMRFANPPAPGPRSP